MQQGSAEIALEAGCGLVALLGRLGEQLHDDRRTTPGTSFSRSAGGVGCLAMWQWTHSIGSDARERQGAREHLVERDAERVEIAAGVDDRFIRPVCSGAM